MVPVQYRVAILCGLVAIIDGFDVQSIAFAAPSITQEWGVSAESFGVVFSAGLFGMLIGVVLQGPIADRIGRKPVILGSVFVFGLLTLATGFAQNIAQLLALRIAAGIGMGAAVPNFIALTGEYAPERIKSRMIVAMNAGFPIGGFLGGLTSAALVGEFGWRSIFYVGGIVPLLLLILLYFKLPESILFAADRSMRRNEPIVGGHVAKMLNMFARSGEKIDANTISWESEKVSAQGFGRIFDDGRAAGTVFLWAACFCSLILFYFLVSWLPSLLVQAGLPQERAIVAAAILNFGSVIGGFVLGWLSDKMGPPRILFFNYILAGLACIAFGLSIDSDLIVVASLAALLGFCCGGGQLMLNAMGAMFYPTAIRSTGLGAAGMAGRAGSLTGPVVGGALLGAGMTISTLFAWLALPAAIAAGSAGLVRLKR